MPMLEIDYYNPVVEDWTPECMDEEIRQRKTCDFVLYVITPEMKGVYSIAEVVDDSNKRPEKTVFCVVEKAEGGLEFATHELKSMGAVKKLVSENGGTVCDSLDQVAEFLNSTK